MHGSATRSDGRARRAPFVLLVLLLCLPVACGSDVPEREDPLAGASQGADPLPDNVGPSDCRPVSATRTLPDGAMEIEGAAEGDDQATLWARLPDGTAPSGVEFRIVWRIPGSSQLRLTALGPDGEQVDPTQVAPTSAPGWIRPGDAWTSTFHLPSPGCWRVNAQRGRIHGDVWFKAG
jgi:hypothetical protein